LDAVTTEELENVCGFTIRNHRHVSNTRSIIPSCQEAVRTHPVLKVDHGQNGTDAISVAQRQDKVKSLEARLIEHSNLWLHPSLQLILAIDEEEDARQVDTIGYGDLPAQHSTFTKAMFCI
jgi:hypothetical protein